MTRIRIEFVHLGPGIVPEAAAQNVVRAVVASFEPIDVAETPTPTEERVLVPDGDGSSPLYALLRAIDGDVVVAWGADPVAALTGPGQKWIGADEEHALLVTPGDLISFMQV